MSYHRRLYAVELMEGLALMKEHKGLDDLSASDWDTKAATYKPRSSWGKKLTGLVLKNKGTGGEEKEERKQETEK